MKQVKANQARTAGHRGASPSIRKVVLITLFLTAPALLAGIWPGLAEVMTYDRQAIAQGEVWRVVTGHWAHWSFDHLAWDLLAFVALLPLCFHVCATRLWATLGASVVAISGGLYVLSPEMLQYRGLSGLDSALFVLLATVLVRRQWARHEHGSAVLVGLMLIGFGLKLVFETATGSTVFVAEAGFVPMPGVHWIGSLCGALIGNAGNAGNAVSPAAGPRAQVS